MLCNARGKPIQTSETARTCDKRQPIIVICRSGGRLRRAAETLVRGGFERVLDMAGGMLRLPRRGPADGALSCRGSCLLSPRIASPAPLR